MNVWTSARALIYCCYLLFSIVNAYCNCHFLFFLCIYCYFCCWNITHWPLSLSTQRTKFDDNIHLLLQMSVILFLIIRSFYLISSFFRITSQFQSILKIDRLAVCASNYVAMLNWDFRELAREVKMINEANQLAKAH